MIFWKLTRSIFHSREYVRAEKDTQKDITRYSIQKFPEN